MTPLQLSSPAPPFDDRLFALSSISHRLAYPSPFKHPSQQQKHLKLLDLLALLLVTEPNGDVAATSLIRTTGQITVLFSKNRPCNPLEKSYVQSIHEIITSITGETTSLQDALQQLLGLVIGNCSRKIKARLNKLVNRLKSLSIGDVVKPLPPHVTLRLWNLLKPTGFPPPSSVPLESSISHWLKSLLQAPVRALAGIQATTTLFVAYSIGHMVGTDPLIDDPILLRRLRKLGDYYAAVRCLVKSYSELKPSDSIIFREIVSPYPESKTLESDVIGTLNSWASHRSHKPLTVGSLLSAYPTLAGASTPNLSLLFGNTLWTTSPDRLLTHTVTTSVHAECNLLLYLTTLNLPAIEFGASKNVCWMCECYITSLNDHYPGTIHFSGRQGKVHAGWQFPEHTPVMVREKIENYLAHELDIVLTRVARERRSDSEPRGSDNGEDEEWQEVKVGEFPEGFWAVGE